MATQQITDQLIAEVKTSELNSLGTSPFDLDDNIKNQGDRGLQAMELLRVSLNNYMLRYAIQTGSHGSLSFPTFYHNIGQVVVASNKSGTGYISYISSNPINHPKKTYINTVKNGVAVTIERTETLFNLALQLSFVVRVARLEDFVDRRYEAQRTLSPIISCRSTEEFRQIWESNRKKISPFLDAKILNIGAVNDRSSSESTQGGTDIFARADLDITLNYVDVNEFGPATFMTCETLPNIRLTIKGGSTIDNKGKRIDRTIERCYKTPDPQSDKDPTPIGDCNYTDC